MWRKWSWKVDACVPGWVRVVESVGERLRELGAELRPFDGRSAGVFPIVRVWAMDLYGQRGKFCPPYELYGGGHVRHAEYDSMRKEHTDRCLGAVLRACRGFAEDPARSVMEAAFVAYALGGPDAVEQAMQTILGG